MKVAFFSVVLNHHQAPLADEMYRILGKEFIFIETDNLYAEDKKGGNDYSERYYLIRAWESIDNYNKCIKIAMAYDVCIFDGGFEFQKARMSVNKLSFEFSERWLKGWKNYLSPRLWRSVIIYHAKGWQKKPLYKLCASAYAAKDQNKFFTYLGRCYKFGYFTSVPERGLPKESVSKGRVRVKRLEAGESVRLMWCSRFIDWKHPELAIQLAERLKQAGYSFVLDLYGDGKLRSKLEVRVDRLELSDYVNFHGNVPNDQIHEAMREHDIFLFTSDRGEGWGAVANEALSEGCLLIASNEIGAVPYLVNDGVNGLIFKSCDLNSLYEKTVWAIENPERSSIIRETAVKTMQSTWSPANAARSLLQLIDDLKNGRETSVKEGPCSKA